MTEPAHPTVAELKAQLAAAEANEISGEGTLSAEPEVSEPDPIPVAEQKAAGVDPDDTVTIAEQRAGAPPPELPGPEAADEPEPDADEPPLIPQLRSGGGTSNEAPLLPPSATTGAARAHALLGHAQDALRDGDTDQAKAIIVRVRDELDRYLPASVKAAAVPEAAQVMAAGL